MPATTLTWHPGSVRPYASLWHTVMRVAALNRLKPRELPMAADPGSTPPQIGVPRKARLLFNERDDAGRPLIAIDRLAAQIGEPMSAFAWSHLGAVPRWSRMLVWPGFRLCPACLADGYHSALLSVRLMQACPIHACALVNRCNCGQPLTGWLDTQRLGCASPCACGQLALFTRQTCRTVAMPAARTAALGPVAQWLQALSGVLRPVAVDMDAQRLGTATWLRHLRQWCDTLGLGYPDCFTPLPGQRRCFSVQTSLLRRSGGAADEIPRPTASAPTVLVEGQDRPPATFAFKAMSRHLRRHVARPPARGPAPPVGPTADPASLADRLRANRATLAAFAAMVWIEQMQPGVSHGPRSGGGGGGGGEVDLRRLVQSMCRSEGGSRPIGADELAWLEYRACGATMTARWSAAMQYAVAVARGLGNPKALDEHGVAVLGSWSAHIGPDEMKFVVLADHPCSIKALPLPDKASRQAAHNRRLALAADGVARACQGPCLIWSPVQGWSVTDAFSPKHGDVRRHRLLGVPGERPSFWLFRYGNHVVARLCATRLQVLASTAREAIDALRLCVAQYRRNSCATGSSASVQTGRDGAPELTAGGRDAAPAVQHQF